MSDKKLWEFVEATTWKYARQLNLPLRKVKPLPPEKWFYGDCSSDGRIRIQIAFQGSPRDCFRLHAYQILDTIAHELAHLRHNKHRPDWFQLHVAILGQMEQDGVYKRLRKLCRAAG
jgi:predicted metal-dependent hydrolase